jgi:hypothetical protein
MFKHLAKALISTLRGCGYRVTFGTGNGVMIDGDDDGFAEESDWIGTRDGILVLDRNADGKISGGHEMFSQRSPRACTRGDLGN